MSTLRDTVKTQDLLFIHTLHTCGLSPFGALKQERASAELDRRWLIFRFILFEHSQLRLCGRPGLQPRCEGKNWGKFPLEFEIAFVSGTRVVATTLESRGCPWELFFFFCYKNLLGHKNEIKETPSEWSLPGYLRKRSQRESTPFIVKHLKRLLHNSVTIKGALPQF